MKSLVEYPIEEDLELGSEKMKDCVFGQNKYILEYCQKQLDDAVGSGENKHYCEVRMLVL